MASMRRCTSLARAMTRLALWNTRAVARSMSGVVIEPDMSGESQGCICW